jgi:hypothetical protein
MEEGQNNRAGMILEDVFIVLSIFALWPGILGWDGAVWNLLQYAAVIGLVWIMVRRVGRYNQRSKEDRT